MNYLVDEYTRNLLLEYFEQREEMQYGIEEKWPNNEMSLANALRDLKPLREVNPHPGIVAAMNARYGGPIS